MASWLLSVRRSRVVRQGDPRRAGAWLLLIASGPAQAILLQSADWPELRRCAMRGGSCPSRPRTAAVEVDRLHARPAYGAGVDDGADGVQGVRQRRRATNRGADFSKNGSLKRPRSASLFLGGKVMGNNIGAFAQDHVRPVRAGRRRQRPWSHQRQHRPALRRSLHRRRRDLILGVSVRNTCRVMWKICVGADGVRAGAEPHQQPVHRRRCRAYPASPLRRKIARRHPPTRLPVRPVRRDRRLPDGERRGARLQRWYFQRRHDQAARVQPDWRLHQTMLGADSLMLVLGLELYDDPLDTSSTASTHKYRVRRPRCAIRVPAGPTVVAEAHSRDAVHADDQRVAYQAHLCVRGRSNGSLDLFNLSGVTDPNNIDATGVSGNATGGPGHPAGTVEAFWTLVQYVRIGAQYTGDSVQRVVDQLRRRGPKRTRQQHAVPRPVAY